MEKITVREFVDNYCTIINEENGTYRLTLKSDYASNDDECCINHLAEEFLEYREYDAFVAFEELTKAIIAPFKCTLKLEDNTNPNSVIAVYFDGEYFASYSDDFTFNYIFNDCIQEMYDYAQNDCPVISSLLMQGLKL